MTQLTSSQAQTQLDLWIAADAALAVGKSYTIGNRQLTRSDAQEVRNQITYWQRAVRALHADEGGKVNGSGYKVGIWNT